MRGGDCARMCDARRAGRLPCSGCAASPPPRSSTPPCSAGAWPQPPGRGGPPLARPGRRERRGRRTLPRESAPRGWRGFGRTRPPPRPPAAAACTVSAHRTPPPPLRARLAPTTALSAWWRCLRAALATPGRPVTELLRARGLCVCVCVQGWEAVSGRVGERRERRRHARFVRHSGLDRDHGPHPRPFRALARTM